MGIFERKKKERAICIAACTDGTVIPMEELPDPAFSEGILGFCAGIQPERGEIYSPVEGTVSQLSDTLHALGIQTAEGVEILLHVGLDTVAMNGEGFVPAVQVGDRVRIGQLLLTADLEKIRSAGYESVVVTAITNSDAFSDVILVGSGRIKRGEALVEVGRKA